MLHVRNAIITALSIALLVACAKKSEIQKEAGKATDDRPNIILIMADDMAIPKGKWKLVAKKDEPWELYNLEEDRTETNNLIESQTQIAGELKKAYEEWAKKTGI